jgi:hypothetical protein
MTLGIIILGITINVTLGIMALSIAIKNMTFGIITLSITIKLVTFGISAT